MAIASGGGFAEAGGSGSRRSRVEVLPTMDGQGRLYDIGTGTGEDKSMEMPGNRKKKEKVFFKNFKLFPPDR